MKFATRQWVRTQQMQVTEIVKEYPKHPEHIKGYCAGCHASLCGKPWTAIWAKRSSGDNGGAYKLCASCTEEAKSEISAG